MKKLLLNCGRLLAAGLLFAAFTPAYAQQEFTVDASLTWNGYINVFENNTEEEIWLFGSPWQLPDLKSVINADENTITLYPNYNTYNVNDPYWSNGAEGNKICEGSTFLESTEWAGEDVTFNGYVEENTLSDEFTAVAFIKALNPDNGWSLDVYVTAELIEGENFILTVPADQLPEGLMVQYGFSVRGLNANPTQETANGNIVVTEFNENVAGINEAGRSTAILHPNPANDVLNITAQNNIDEINIYNMLGQKVLSAAPKTASASLNISALSNGVYILNMASDSKESSLKFIKK